MKSEYQGTIYEHVKFTPKEINMNFKIKVVGMNRDRPVERLVGVSGLIEEVGSYELVNSLLTRAFKCKTDKLVCKLRRGIKIIFFRH